MWWQDTELLVENSTKALEQRADACSVRGQIPCACGSCLCRGVRTSQVFPAARARDSAGRPQEKRETRPPRHRFQTSATFLLFALHRSRISHSFSRTSRITISITPELAFRESGNKQTFRANLHLWLPDQRIHQPFASVDLEQYVMFQSVQSFNPNLIFFFFSSHHSAPYDQWRTSGQAIFNDTQSLSAE